MLAISVFHAIKDAVASVGEHRLSPRLDAPATAEQILEAHRKPPYRRMASENESTEGGATGATS